MPPRKRAKLDVDWSWAGIEAEKPDEISAHHRRRAAGLHGITPCRFDPYPSDVAESSTSSRKKSELGCSAKLCRNKPRCYNHLGVHQVTSLKAKEEFVEKKAGGAPEMRSGSEPIGLRNMGATCYANAFLQLWYHNVAFRNGLYSCTTAEGSKLKHLVEVFTHLQHSKRKVVDPSGLVKALKLDTGAQQDAGEFSKLFMNVIDIELRRQQDPNLQRLYEHLFQGKLAYVTQCSGCGATSEREENFLELELSLKNNDTLTDRIRALTQPELLDGDNKYRCGTCGKLCAATRKVDIRVLPQYLNFGLLRFTYDVKDGERRKSKAAIRYPKSYVFYGCQYDLCAVVVHLGSTPYHGHFVCELLDDMSKEWYTCSDEEVTKRVPNALKKLGQPDDGLDTSKDAYMLVFKKRSTSPEPEPVVAPEAMMQAVKEDDEALEMEMTDWVKRCELAGVEFDDLKSIKEPIISALSGTDQIIPRDELARWLGGDTEALSKPIDFSALTCQHSSEDVPRLDPSKMGDARLISRKAMSLIQEHTPCAELDICPTCIEDTFKHKVSASDREDQVREFDALNGGPVIESPKYLISKSWLDKWRKNDLSIDSLPNDNGYSLYCGHEAPWPGDRSYYRIAPEALVLLRSAVGDFDAFEDTAAVCDLCLKENEVDGAARKVWLEELKRDKAIKKEIRPSSTIYNVDYYILSAPWIARWRRYLVEPGPRPPYRADICEHDRIPFDPGNDRTDYITEKGWTALQAVYGEQRAITMQFKPNDIPGQSHPVSNVSIAVCEPCRLARRLDWVETDVSIYLEDDSAVVIPTDESAGVPMKRKRSSRQRKKPLVLPITKATTVKHVRLQILSAFNIFPMAQSLWYGELELDDGEQTMADIGMVSDGELRLVELDQEELGKEGGSGGMEGFGGTALLGIKECPDCTYHNEAGADGCVICGRPFL